MTKKEQHYNSAEHDTVVNKSCSSLNTYKMHIKECSIKFFSDFL